MVNFILEDGDKADLAELGVVLGPFDQRSLRFALDAKCGRHNRV